MAAARPTGTKQSQAERAMRSLSVREDLGPLLGMLNLTGSGAEIGVFKGDFAETILKRWEGERLLLIDAWKHLPDYLDSWNLSNPQSEENYRIVRHRMSPFSNRVRIMRMRSLQAAELIRDSSLDFVYIDANHGYSATLADMKAWYPKVRPGGLMSGHDYYDARADGNLEPLRNDCGPPPTRAELTSYGVKSAVNDFIKRLKVQLFVTDEVEPTWLFRKR